MMGLPAALPHFRRRARLLAYPLRQLAFAGVVSSRNDRATPATLR